MTTQFGLFSPDDNKDHTPKQDKPDNQLRMFSDSETVQFGVTTSRPLMPITSPDMKLPLLSQPEESEEQKAERNEREAREHTAPMFEPEPNPTLDEYSFEWFLSLDMYNNRPACQVCGSTDSTVRQRERFVLCDNCARKATSYRAERLERADRFDMRAETARNRSQQRFDHAHQIGSMIPMGQPILVGHHSEKMHRSHLRKIDTNMRKGIEEQKKAEHYERKADSARKNRAISSDDPTAIPQLEAKIAKLTEKQELMKRVNRKVRSAIKQGEKGNNPVQWLIDNCDDVTQEKTAINLLEPDFAGRVGFASYQLQNNNQNINRLKKRLASMKARQEKISEVEETAGEPVTRETFGEIELERDYDDNRLRLHFPGKPDSETRAYLKSRGFRWSRQNMAWQRHLNNAGEYAAKQVIAYVYPGGIPD